MSKTSSSHVDSIDSILLSSEDCEENTLDTSSMLEHSRFPVELPSSPASFVIFTRSFAV